MTKPKTLQQAIIYFADHDNCTFLHGRAAGRTASECPYLWP